jgi:hypothetical protein
MSMAYCRVMTRTVTTLWLVAIGTLLACTQTGAPVATTPQPTASATLGSPDTSAPPGYGADIQPVSASKPGPEAADVMSKCHVGDGDSVSLKQVTGMGKIASAADLPHYVPLTGREPQLKDPGPAWVIQVKGDIPQKNGEVWTDPTCVVTSSIFGYFGTGPTKLPNGDVVAPEPPALQPDRTVPPLAP